MGAAEGKIQKFAMDEFKKRGALVRKISYEGRRGCPDLLVVVNGFVLFLEMKKSADTEAEAHQKREHMRLVKKGATVHVVGDERQVMTLVAKYCGMG